jgi:Pup amidohydrolase
VGTTAVVLAMVEDAVIPPRDLALADPVRAMHRVSADLTLAEPLEMADGSTATALEIQWDLFTTARKYEEEYGLAALGDETVARAVIDRWEQVLSGLETDPAGLSHQLDWVAKHQIMLAYCDRHGCGWDDDRLAALDLQYHDLRPERSLYARLGMERLVDDAQVAAAVTNPPRDTRAWFRGQCLARWPAAVITANWDSLVFDLGTDPLRRVPMMDPLKGTAEHTEALLDASTGPADLLERLGS